MFVVREIGSLYQSRIVGSAPTAEEAIKRFLPAKLLLIEEDRDNPGCFDAMSIDLRQFTVEPDKNV